MSDALLSDYLRTWPRPWCWAQAHCGTLVVDWVRAATGHDVGHRMPAAGSAWAWALEVRRSGGMQALVSRVLGCQPVPVAEAQPGDVLLYPADVTGGALALAAHASAAVVLAEGGRLAVVPQRGAVCAWRLAEVQP